MMERFARLLLGEDKLANIFNPEWKFGDEIKAMMIPCLPEFWTAWKGADYLRTCFKDFVYTCFMYVIILKSIMEWALTIKMLIKFHNHICELKQETEDWN
ncbi:unnamed protein product [Trifolium pratense]|uniref:Uncharacterized protein n=1 Tax=Trifolium pratense TaxID=57577 RepID=A0ACB0JMU5_TRIPR|nr:unnamed protein product [Trifolium pratense]